MQNESNVRNGSSQFGHEGEARRVNEKFSKILANLAERSDPMEETEDRVQRQKNSTATSKPTNPRKGRNENPYLARGGPSPEKGC
ncbi:hypothetical protein K0M31_018696 [Melipona bicolor]|uniref:Uncharacterized protein n=1 Tax=Melipona bicolor TaxID=60889 RepID=A0AA40KRY3_9HYME|nr:hypothetical protein K0M31_018696 [Melipona bicolor]